MDPRRDPTSPPPPRRPTVMGARLAVPIEQGEVRMTSTGGSVFPRAIAEAGTVKVTTSLLLLGAILAGGYYAGQDAGIAKGRIVRSAEICEAQAKRIEELQAAIVSLTQQIELNASREAGHEAISRQTNASVEVLRSHAESKRR